MRFDNFIDNKNDNIDCAAFDLLGLLASPGPDIPEYDPPVEWDMEIIGDLVGYAEHLLAKKKIPVCHPYFEGDDETPCCLGKDCKRKDCLLRQ